MGNGQPVERGSKLLEILKEELARVEALDSVDYADVRFVEKAHEGLQMRNGRVEYIHQGEERGFGVRVLFNGAWGFAASSRLNEDEIRRIFDLAVDIARSSAGVSKEKVVLAPVEAVIDKYTGGWKIDPFQVSMDDKLALLEKAAAPLMGPEIMVAESNLDFFRINTTFISSEGSEIAQEIIESGGGISVVAVRDGEPQMRSYPNSFGGNYATRGYEFVQSLGLENEGERIR